MEDNTLPKSALPGQPAGEMQKGGKERLERGAFITEKGAIRSMGH